MSELHERLTDLEVRYSHQERVVEQLSDLVREQQDTIDALVKQLRRLSESAEANEAAPPHEKPPHY